ncbi:hypothetical protein DL240_09800 [Lujinxingia litoralis]|uniref:Peptidase M48 domain-containing protein n=1 Tax=Lujinxingia litoralis TaxID=2211119 RepID=A0A328C4F3_9DELT|nr:M48 family metallopeptidase [Lujinxingia litoralis]RAL22139.1 hypothetical protein DL240_09800 [Lujinxingia litoralis]
MNRSWLHFFAPAVHASDSHSVRVPRHALQLNGAYLIRVGLLAAALIGLLALYFGALILCVAASVVVVKHALSGPIHLDDWLLGALTLTVFLPLALVLIKGLFHRQTVDRSQFIELNAEHEPELFRFLTDLSRRAGAPLPHKVYACPQVNAGVFYDTSLLNLIFPVRKNLLIGLGLINTLNRTELEAVLAHELGHFSQRSMRLSHYVYVVAQVLRQLVEGHDPIDRALARARTRWHRGLGIPFGLELATRLVRAIARRALAALERLDASVSRQMELHADRVAVRLTGSDALIHALKRADWADRCYSQTRYDLEQAADQGMRTNDFFVHHSALMDAMRERLGDPTLGQPPTLPTDPTRFEWVFDPQHTEERADLFDSHPPHHVREAHARMRYERTSFDERSAWTLFETPENLRQALTRTYNAAEFGDPAPTHSADSLQRHLAGEHDEILLSPRESVVFGHRYVEFGNLDEVFAAAEHEESSDAEIAQWLHELIGPTLDQASARLERQLPHLIRQPVAAQGHARPLRSPATTQPCPPGVDCERDPEKERRWFAQLDADLMHAHLVIASRLDPALATELRQRYLFHDHLQQLARWMRHQSPALARVTHLVSETQLDDDALQWIFETLVGTHATFYQALHPELPLPEMHGVDAHENLRQRVLAEPLIDLTPVMEGRLEHTWLNAFVAQWQQASERVDHLRRKSLGAMLVYQRELVARWDAR